MARLEVYLRCLDKEPLGVFHKAWTPDCSKWSSREAEILGWQAYTYDLTAWAMHSLEFVKSSMPVDGQIRCTGIN